MQIALCQDPIATPYWRTSFENGFPGEWHPYNNGSWSEDGSDVPGRTETWTIVPSADLTEGAIEGDYMYKGWISAADTISHRAYPGIHVDFPSPLVNSWWVYLDTDFDNFPQGGWHHFATWGNNPDWDVHTMSAIRSGNLEMAHVEDYEVVGDIAMPLRQWVRFTAYIAYAPAGDNEVFVWMNGEPIMRAKNNKPGGSNLQRAHWGLYASGNLFEGIQYNDDIQIWGLSEAWTDFDREPPSPYDETSNLFRSWPQSISLSEVSDYPDAIWYTLEGRVLNIRKNVSQINRKFRLTVNVPRKD